MQRKYILGKIRTQALQVLKWNKEQACVYLQQGLTTFLTLPFLFISFTHTVKVMWHTTKYGDPYSEFVLCIYPSKVYTHSSEQTHTVNTHPEQWAAIYAAAPGEQLGVRCLAQGHLSHGIEGGESAVHSLPPPTIPAGPETQTRNLGLRVWLSNH